MLAAAALGGLYAYAGVYGLHVLFRHGGSWWVPVGTDSARLSPSMRLAFGAAPVATAGEIQWRPLSVGFDVADLPARVGELAVRQTVLLVKKLTTPAPAAKAAADPVAARKQIVHQVEDSIERDAPAEQTEPLHTELAERLEAPDAGGCDCTQCPGGGALP